MARKSLETWCNEKLRQDLLDEWDSEKNGMIRFFTKTSMVPYNSPTALYWKCKKGHRWESPVAARTLFKLNCPVCNPGTDYLPVGTKYGCLTIMEVIPPKNDSSFWGDRPTFECRCKCGLTHSLTEFHFLETKHRFCTEKDDSIPNPYRSGSESPKIVCGLRKKKEEDMLKSYKREFDESYDIDYTNTFHESLEVLECVNDHYEKLHSWGDKRRKGSGAYKVYKLYRCRCYLCGREHEIKSSDFAINLSTYDGYASKAFCDCGGCRIISSFQWIVNKILKENGVAYRVEVTFPDLYGSKNQLRFDFGILDDDGNIKCLIECQGEQHFKPVDEFGGKALFETQKKNDELKRAYAEEHGIPLYEISYKEKKYEKIELFLKTNEIYDCT